MGKISRENQTEHMRDTKSKIGKKLWNKKEGKKKTEKKRDQVGINRQVLKVAYLFAGLFLVLMVYIGYFVVVDSEEIITNPRNQRQDMFAKSIIRGKIESSDGKVLAETKVSEDGSETRVYPYENMYAHVVGYADKGKFGLESIGNYNLLTSNANFFERLYNTLTEKKNIGDTLVSTLDSRLQKAAYDALGDRKGAVIVMEPSTGKILAMVSKPDFNPNKIVENWDYINSEEQKDNSRLLNRATQGLYPPGSTFKIITALEYIRENPDYKNYRYNCKSEGIFNGIKIHCYNQNRHGEQNLTESFENSCNTSFANIGIGLNKGKFYKLCEELLFNKALPVDFSYKKSSFVLNSKSKNEEVPQTAIGQGNTGMTPLHNLMITAAIANGGVLMQPYFIDHLENYTGGQVKKYAAKSYGQLMTAKEAAQLITLMRAVVEEGTASSLKDRGYTAAGKTGSAEFEEGKAAHAWFTGFAPVDNPEIAVCVIVENVGAGSTYAVPVAQKIMDTYFQK